MTTASDNVSVKDYTQTTLRNFGRAHLADYFGDLIIYRNLEPLDRRIRGLKNSAYQMEIANDYIPRKQDRDYAKAAVWFAKQAQQKVRKNNTELRELLFLGDTFYNDGQAYANMRKEAGWIGTCFIGNEKVEEEFNVEINEGDIYVANRWAAVADWVRWSLDQGLHIDARTVVVVDIDKTALGAKGRNDSVINEARLEGIYRTMDAVLGDGFNRAAFERQYAELNRSRYHFLTEDNQDYLAYICLVVNAGLIDYDEVLEEARTHSLDNFEQFLRWVDSRMMLGSPSGESIRQVHEAVINSVRIGDPTPFKRFRRQEFIATVERMGNIPDNSPIEEILDSEITLTNEICELSEWLRKRNCLMLCLSDKPDEASCPDRHVSPDMPPVHQAETHRVGTSIIDELNALG